MSNTIKNLIEKTFIINLPERTERLQFAKCELEKQGITDYEVFAATKHQNGSIGIMISMIRLIEQCYFAGYKNFLMVEDDIESVGDFNKWFDYSIQSFISRGDFDILYLGCNSHELHEPRTPFSQFHYSLYQQLLCVKDVYGCHAMIWSRQGMYQFLKMVHDKSIQYYSSDHNGSGPKLLMLDKVMNYNKPNDVLIQEIIQPLGRCYASYPMIFTQRSGYSDIEKKEMNQDYIVRRFTQQTQKLFGK
jgi:hypothetical protein